MESQDPGGERPERKLALVPRPSPELRKLDRLRLEEAVRERFLRGERKGEIARTVGVTIGFVTATLARFQKELERAPRVEAGLYRQRMIEALERLKFRCYAALDRSEEERKRTRSEQVRGPDGKIAGSKTTVEHLEGGLDSKLAAVLVAIELKLGQLHGVEEAVEPEGAKLLSREFYYVSPARPLDLERLAKLNQIIEAREVKVIEAGEVVANKGNGKAAG